MSHADVLLLAAALDSIAMAIFFSAVIAMAIFFSAVTRARFNK